MLLYRGKERLMVDKIIRLPCETFLKNLAPVRDPRAAIE
jgi:hypothetical protein